VSNAAYKSSCRDEWQTECRPRPSPPNRRDAPFSVRDRPIPKGGVVNDQVGRDAKGKGIT